MENIEIERPQYGRPVATVTFDCGCVACDEPYYPSIYWCPDHSTAISDAADRAADDRDAADRDLAERARQSLKRRLGE